MKMSKHDYRYTPLPAEALSIAALYTTAHDVEAAARKEQARAVSGLFGTLWRAIRGVRVDMGAPKTGATAH
jgi:hypothetical protein